MESSSDGPSAFWTGTKIRQSLKWDRIPDALALPGQPEFFSDVDGITLLIAARHEICIKCENRVAITFYQRVKHVRRPSAAIDRGGDNFIPVEHHIFRISIWIDKALNFIFPQRVLLLIRYDSRRILEIKSKKVESPPGDNRHLLLLFFSFSIRSIFLFSLSASLFPL